jgi:peptide/nickel transport system substrate-binding protein
MPDPGDVTAAADSEGPRAQLRAFLLSDIRGFSSFSALRGAEASSALTRRFGAIATEVLLASGGVIVDMTGDEVLAAFESPRQAIRAAIDFQNRLLAATQEDPTLPLPAGVGLDFGEGVVTNGRWSANAINVAARLCSLAGGGEILATAELAHVAQAMDGVTYETRSSVAVKGIPQPVRRVRVLEPDADNVKALQELGLARAAPLPVEPKSVRKPLAAAIAAGVAIAVAATAIVVHLHGDDASIAIGANAIGQIDSHGKVLRQVAVGNAPGAMAADKSAIWVVNTVDDTVSRIDAADQHAPANTIKVGEGPSDVALGAGAAWVTNTAGRTVSRINPGSAPTVGDTIEVGNGPSAVTVGFGLVWVANSIDDTVSVLDPESSNGQPADHIVATIPVGAQPEAIVAGLGSVWVANAGSSTISRIDPKSRTVETSISVGNGPRAVAVGKDGLWVANTLDDTVSRIDPATAIVTDVVPVGHQPSGLAVSAQKVWVSNSNSDSLSSIDEHGRKVVKIVPLDGAPQAVAADGDAFWVSARTSAASHTGGTLKIAANDATPTLDPATGYGSFAWSIASMTNDGLVTYERSPGPAGASVTADLAQRLPTISDGGRTYSFQLRSGIRYSDGTAVKASDVRSSMERTLRLSEAADYYFSSIRGASGCSSASTTCDLSAGIVSNDAVGSVVIHLSKPDPDLLYKLALPFSALVPSTTPRTDTAFGPHAGTGPYVLSKGSPSAVVLTRNKYFKQWSALAQPDGYPDRVEITLTMDDDSVAAHRDATAVAKGTYDWLPAQLSSTDVSDLVRTKTAQMHPYDLNVVHYYFLNTTRAPFDDPRVRRAVNFAIDRRAAARVLGGTLLAIPTCQTTTPSVGGYSPYCPYTLNPGANRWSAPDLPKAKALIRAAGASGAPVTLTTSSDVTDIAHVVAKAMRSIGLAPTIRLIPQHDGDYYDYIEDQSNHVQAAFEGWGVDYPEPSALIGQLLRCSSRTPVHNVDESLFCDAGVDNAIDAALALQSSDPASSGAAWAAIDRQIVDQAPWVPLVTDRGYDVVSPRLGNYQHHPVFGFLIDQAWVQ